MILTTPYDWSVTATPLPAWLGGHSQRGENKGGSEYVLRSLLAQGKHPAAIQELELIAESMEEEWSVRLHDRGVMQYRTHVAAVRKRK